MVSGVRPTGALQENLLTILSHDDVNGKIVAGLVSPELFEGDYRVIAERCLDFWEKCREAPKAHVVDLVADILEDPNNRKAHTYHRILAQMLELAGAVNTTYVLGEIRKFIRMQRLKQAIMESSTKFAGHQEMAIEEVEKIWNDILSARQIDHEPGLRLSDTARVVQYLDVQYSEFTTGIKVLDDNFIVPYRGSPFLFIAPAGAGKTHAAVQVGTQAVLDRKKVLHVCQEMAPELIAQRYYQRLFGASKREEKVGITILGRDRLGRLDTLQRDEVQSDWTFASPHLAVELEAHAQAVGTRLNNLIIVRFPMRTLTGAKLRAYLDNLEVVEHFIPDLVIVENIGLMKTDPARHRIDLGRNFEDICGLAIERSHALWASHQVSREGAASLMTRSTHVAEDWSLIHTAEVVVTYTATDAETQLGLARLFINKARNEKDHWVALITQNYAMGQFCLDSVMMPKKYFDFLDKAREEYGEESSDGDEDNG